MSGWGCRSGHPCTLITITILDIELHAIQLTCHTMGFLRPNHAAARGRQANRIPEKVHDQMQRNMSSINNRESKSLKSDSINVSLSVTCPSFSLFLWLHVLKLWGILVEVIGWLCCILRNFNERQCCFSIAAGNLAVSLMLSLTDPSPFYRNNLSRLLPYCWEVIKLFVKKCPSSQVVIWHYSVGFFLEVVIFIRTTCL